MSEQDRMIPVGVLNGNTIYVPFTVDDRNRMIEAALKGVQIMWCETCDNTVFVERFDDDARMCKECAVYA